ncbi:MAG TPA: MBL fold metallo-hydrolase [Methanoregulaceae archaeon]|nr:MAG: MBL fold metallo-hydrolase [Methanolinea sp.]HON82075.1 MBL fold metallo-hydrolase [Methanoregulaceae archaeon]HPD10773.1 MBL fold metallo-hydrolase [Methanoregulaceae archaeon]HRT15961.1 MBL fold metallo-hydrolase [Methanoregulaceae archaeon]HRU31426.1 MBL fold metallo-hydrolase [Methanoregulaceae archaeon]
MAKYTCVAKMPNDPGALHSAVALITRYQGNINRVQFDQRIDPRVVFFEITCPDDSCARIEDGLAELGYLQDSLQPLHVLRFSLPLPHEPGALCAFLDVTTSSRANICAIDFDDRGRHPDRMTITLSVEEHAAAERLLDTLKSRYPIEILEYDSTGKKLDDTVFYLRLAQQIREIIGDSQEPFLLSFLGDINHAVQELMNLGKDPRTIFESFLQTGRTLAGTTGDRFYADIQTLALTPYLTLHCIQPPCGGNIFLMDTPDGITVVDTGYGIYMQDIVRLLDGLIPGWSRRVSALVITHGDADHCGAGGAYPVPAQLHPGTLEVIRAANRAYGSRSETSVLEEIYTTMINLFSRFTPPLRFIPFSTDPLGYRAGFPVIGMVDAGRYRFEVLESPGGHLHGQVYLYCREIGVLFTADTVINFGHLTPDRAAYNTLAVILVTSVNVDSEVAKHERSRVLDLARESSGLYENGRTSCLLCCGHGPVSVLSGDKLVPFGDTRHYDPAG